MHHYYIFYKPYQVLSQFSKEGDKKTLANFLFNIPKDVYPVGRLDYDSEGLLLLTNDKKITHRLLEPQYKHPRTYYVQVEGTIEEEAVKKLEDGVMISINGKPYFTSKAAAKKLLNQPLLPERNPPIRYRKNIPTSWLALTITEGKNRQVRKMTAAVGFPTLRLVRYRIGQVSIEGMSPGEVKTLHSRDLSNLFIKE